MRRFFGYTLTIKGLGYVNQEKAEIVRFIYSSYLDVHGLGGISKLLQQRNIPSPTGNAVWGRAAIDKMLSNPKYIHYIVDRDLYYAVQVVKENRCNVDISSGEATRKSTHYSSKATLNNQAL
ncbi:MAG: recombinase family protein [Christensenellaceae bacterium]